MDRAFKVTFLIAGCQKSGTTALAHFLSRHPDICMARCKEVHMFDAPDFDDGWLPATINQRYRSFFPDYDNQPCVGEATPIYMYLPKVPPRIQCYDPSMKIILLLRNPIERAISHYNMERGRGNESLPLLLAFMAEHYRLTRDGDPFAFDSAHRRYSYIDRGFYARQIRHIFQYFPRSQLLVLDSCQLLKFHHGTLAQVCDFLGVRQYDPPPDQKRIFVGSGLATAVPAWFRAWLRRRYAVDMRELEALMGRPLSSWNSSCVPSV